MVAYAPLYPAAHSRRTLAELDREVREHLADPATLAMAHLLVAAWGGKPPGQAHPECQTTRLQLNPRKFWEVGVCASGYRFAA